VSEPTQFQRLSIDIDTRMADLWLEAWEWDDEWDLDSVGLFMRLAYGLGYTDALTEPSSATLHRTHGYRIPERKDR
jgi:hypothetical protein